MAFTRILVVDDDKAILAVCRRVLEAEGHSVDQARRAEEALEKHSAVGFDLVLTDVRMPGLSGLELAAELRRLNDDVVIVVMTGFSSMDLAIKALSLGVDEFIIKPFTPDGLRLTVDRALDKARMRRENQRLRVLEPLLELTRRFALARNPGELRGLLLDGAGEVLKSEDLAVVTRAETGECPYTIETRGSKFKGLASIISEGCRGVLKGWQDASIQVWEGNGKEIEPFGPVAASTWLVLVPLRNKGETLGAVVGLTHSPLSKSEIEGLEIMGSLAASIFENVTLLSHAQMVTERVESGRIHSVGLDRLDVEGMLASLKGALDWARNTRENLAPDSGQVLDQFISQAEKLLQVTEDQLSTGVPG